MSCGHTLTLIIPLGDLSPRWQALSDAEKKGYTDLAKTKNSINNDNNSDKKEHKETTSKKKKTK